MKTLDQYITKLPAAQRVAIEEGARQKMVALRLQQAREAAGLTQEEVAERMGITQATLSRWEHRGDVKLNKICRFIEAIGGTLEMDVVLPARSGSRSRQGRRSPTKHIHLVSA